MQGAWITAQPHIASLLQQEIPQVLALIGETGCGKHTVCAEMARKLDTSVDDISSQISEQLIDELYQSPIQKIYLVDISKVAERWQNALLKLLEEPPAASHIVVIAETEVGLLDTVAGRCFKVHFRPYCESILRQCAEDDWKYCQFCTTPGQIVALRQEDMEALFALSELIVDKLCVASIPNALSLVEKIRWKDEKGKHPWHALMQTVSGLAYRRMAGGTNAGYYYKVLMASQAFLRDALTPNIDKKLRFEQFIMESKA